MTVNHLVNLPKGILKVENPDHPFTFDGPDILLSNSNGLVAVFDVRESEIKNINKILTRLTNSIIAYPAHTQMVLLHKPEISISNTEIIRLENQYFNKVLDTKDLIKSTSIFKERKSEQTIYHIKKNQHRLFEIQSKIQIDNIEYIEKGNFSINNYKPVENSIIKSKAEYNDQFSQKKVKSRANIYEHNQYFFANKKLSNKISDIIELKPYYEFSISSDFANDNGVPYFNSISDKLLNLSDIPKNRFDPLKPIRLASLFGWHIANTDKLNELEERLTRFKSK